MIYTYREVGSLVKKDIGSQLLLRRIEAGYTRLGVITGVNRMKYRVEITYTNGDGEHTISLENDDSVVLGA
jgi:hypothetical protein